MSNAPRPDKPNRQLVDTSVVDWLNECSYVRVQTNLAIEGRTSSDFGNDPSSLRRYALMQQRTAHLQGNIHAVALLGRYIDELSFFA